MAGEWWREVRSASEADEIQRHLPPDLGLLLAALRSEFDAKLNATVSRLRNQLLVMGIPLGAVGGFAAEWVRTGSSAEAALFFIPFL